MRRVVAITAGAILLGNAGCEPRDPLDRIVSARTPVGFATWRSHINSNYSAEDRRRVDEALQEIRLRISGEREIKRRLDEPPNGGTETIDEALRERANGRPLREILQLGYELRL